MKIEVPDLQSDERGVSPVIGVILMVAITVILAAVIGAFVLDLGSQLGSTGPQTQLAVSDASASVGSGTSAAVVNIEHKGGDDLKTSDLKIIVTNGTTTFSDTDVTNGWDGGALGYSSTAAEFTVGDTLTISEGSATVAAGDYTVKVIHQPSNSVVASTKVEVN